MGPYIVIPVNILLGHFIQHLYAFKVKSVIETILEGIIESFHRRIVIGTSCFAHALGNFMFLAKGYELPGRKLYSLVTV